jgi:hypothetical protein
MSGGAVMPAPAQNELSAIIRTTEQFAAAGDAQDAEMLDQLLADSFRLVWNDLVEGATTIFGKATYLGMIRDKKVGGDERSVVIESIEMIEGCNAVVRIKLIGKKADFRSFYSLLKHPQKGWLIVQDQLCMQAK